MPNDGVASTVTMADTDARKSQMTASWAAYRGNMPDALKIEQGQTNDNVKVNRMAPIVDKGVAFLFGQVLKITVDDAAPADAQEYLDGCWGHDDVKMTLLGKLAVNGGVTGHCFAKMIPPAPDQGRPYCRVVALDTLNMSVTTDPDDCDTVLEFVIEYDYPDPTKVGGMTRKRQIITRHDPDNDAAVDGGIDRDSLWVIQDLIRLNAAWLPMGEPLTWPYPFAPIAECQNLPAPNDFWGQCDVTPDIIELNKVLNFVESNISRIIKSHAHPHIYASGVNANQASIKSEPGRIVILPPGAVLNALQAHGDIASSMTFAEDLRVSMDEQSRVPAVALGRLTQLPRGAISGVALQLLFQPLLEKTTQKQRQYGELIRNLSKWMLILGGYDLATVLAWDIQLHWQPLLPADDLQAAQTALILAQLSVSQSTILSGLGLDPDAESDKVATEQAKQVTAYAQGQALPPTAPLPNANAPVSSTDPGMGSQTA